jgi:hypothetical protein
VIVSTLYSPFVVYGSVGSVRLKNSISSKMVEKTCNYIGAWDTTSTSNIVCSNSTLDIILFKI